MELCYEQILYDNSLKKGRDSFDEGSKKQPYPGMEQLISMLKKQYPRINISGNKVEINGKIYLIRYNSHDKREFGGIRTQGEYLVFAIVNNKTAFSLYLIDSNQMQLIWEKRENTRGKKLNRAGSWSLNKDDTNCKEELLNVDSVQINQRISDIIRGGKV